MGTCLVLAATLNQQSPRAPPRLAGQAGFFASPRYSAPKTGGGGAGFHRIAHRTP
jgi:hypothetical protein